MKEKEHRALSMISADIERTNKALKDAEEATSMARSNETSVLNKLNSLQKEFDAAVTELKANAPRSANWKSKTYQEVEIEQYEDNMDKITESKTPIQPVVHRIIGVQYSDIPQRPDPVLAVIESQNDLGRREWREVVFHDEDQWCSFYGSNTFSDGEKVTRWIYVDEVI